MKEENEGNGRDMRRQINEEEMMRKEAFPDEGDNQGGQ